MAKTGSVSIDMTMELPGISAFGHPSRYYARETAAPGAGQPLLDDPVGTQPVSLHPQLRKLIDAVGGDPALTVERAVRTWIP